MLKNARLYEDELQKLFFDVWYDPEYQYYFGGTYRWKFGFSDNDYYVKHDFVSLDKGGNVLGYICYAIDPMFKLAKDFGAINFSDDKLTFGMDLYKVVDDIFNKFGVETLEFSVVCGNPIEKGYDKIIEKIGGRILCVRHARATDMAGNICDDKVYEVTRSEYFLSKHSKLEDANNENN